MTMTINRAYAGFKININEPGFGHYSVFARNTDEVKAVIEHYYSDKGHIAGSRPEDCPLCKRCLEESKKEVRKRKPKQK